MPDNTDFIGHAKREEIANKLNSRTQGMAGAGVCPMCKRNDWLVGDGYIHIPITNKMMHLQIGGRAIPSVIIICKNCGFVSHHSLAVLGYPIEEITGKEAAENGQ
ncbi:MAG: hypothetical protein E3J72_19345 [Planctomycetota bacterium]|nr:MAG: hypothetical protein E3J72_19345 [Planctomycetota bacterium]